MYISVGPWTLHPRYIRNNNVNPILFYFILFVYNTNSAHFQSPHFHSIVCNFNATERLRFTPTRLRCTPTTIDLSKHVCPTRTNLLSSGSCRGNYQSSRSRPRMYWRACSPRLIS